MATLYGTYSVTMDAKRRIAVPAALRYSFPEGERNQIIITRGIDKCITGYPYREWNEFLKLLNEINIDEITKRKIKRQFIGRAKEEIFDKQGRILLPEDLVNYAELKDCNEVLVVGIDNLVEIWNPALFEADGASCEEAIQESLGKSSRMLKNIINPETN